MIFQNESVKAGALKSFDRVLGRQTIGSDIERGVAYHRTTRQLLNSVINDSNADSSRG